MPKLVGTYHLILQVKLQYFCNSQEIVSEETYVKQYSQYQDYYILVGLSQRGSNYKRRNLSIRRYELLYDWRPIQTKSWFYNQRGRRKKLKAVKNKIRVI